MFNWVRGFWLGLLSTAVLTLLAVWFNLANVENELGTIARQELSASHPWAKVQVDGRDILVSGTAPSQAASETAISAVRSNSDIRAVTDLTDQLPVVTPYVFRGTLENGAINLSGHVPSEDLGNSLKKIAMDVVGEGKVSGQPTLARGEPEGFPEMAKSALGLFENLVSGTVELEGSRMVVRGEAAGLDQYEALLEASQDGASPTAGISVQVTPPVVKPYKFSAAIQDQSLVLEGFVPQPQTRAQLEKAATGLIEGTTVENRLRIAGGAPESFDKILEQGLALLPSLKTGGISIVDNSVSITGEANDLESYQKILSGISALPPGYTLGENAVDPMSVSSYLFSALKSDGKLKLEGFMPGREIRQDVLQQAQEFFPGVEIINNIKIAEGVPEGLEWPVAAKHVLELLSGLSEGSASITNDAISIDGVAQDRSSYDKVLADIGDGLKGGLKFGSADILPPAASPYRWRVEKSDEGVSVSGNAPSSKASSELAAMVMQLMKVEEISNNQTIARGMPDDFGRVQQIATGLLAQMETGILHMFGRAVSISGEADSKQVADNIAATLSGTLPEGYKGASRITVRQPNEAPKQEEEPAENASACEGLINTTINERKISFAVNRATLLEDSRVVLDDIARAALECPKFGIEIHGHTDSDGGTDYNQKLSEGRAAAVLKYLTDAGIASERLVARGYGESTPLAGNDSDEGKARNRRIEFKVIE